MHRLDQLLLRKVHDGAMRLIGAFQLSTRAAWLENWKYEFVKNGYGQERLISLAVSNPGFIKLILSDPCVDCQDAFHNFKFI